MVQRRGKADLLQRPVETRKMRLEVDEPPVENGGDLIDSVPEQKGAVEYRDLGLLFGEVDAVHIDDAGH